MDIRIGLLVLFRICLFTSFSSSKRIVKSLTPKLNLKNKKKKWELVFKDSKSPHLLLFENRVFQNFFFLVNTSQRYILSDRHDTQTKTSLFLSLSLLFGLNQLKLFFLFLFLFFFLNEHDGSSRLEKVFFFPGSNWVEFCNRSCVLTSSWFVFVCVCVC